MARLADDSGTGTRKTVPTPRTSTSTSPSSVRAADEARITPTTAATESPAFQNQPARTLTAEERATQLRLEREAAYRAAQAASQGTKPEAPAADENYTYDYVWRQDVGAPTGKWVLVRYPKANTGAGGTTTGAGGTGGAGNAGGAGGAGGTTTGPTGPTTTYTAPDGKVFTDINSYNSYVAELNQAAKTKAGQSGYDLLYQQFNKYGLGALVEPLKNLITQGLSDAEFTLRLRDTDAYKKRFAANAQRVAKGLRALSEAEYIALEDQYQNVMRNYGMPESYYSRGEMGRQEGFEKFIAGDVSAAELEDRILTAQDRLINAAPEIMGQLKGYYNISDGDILTYILDPQNAISQIKRKVQAAEIGGAAVQAGLDLEKARAEELQRYGVTKQTAQQGYQAIAGYLPRASQLGDIYAKQGMGPFTQATAESEVFGTPGSAEASAKRKKLSELEQASFSGQAGRAQGALARERAGQF